MKLLHSRVLSESTDRLLTVECSVGAAEKLLATTFRQLVHSASGQRLLRAAEYTVPTELESAISSVFGLHGMPLPPRARRTTPLTPPKPWGADVVAPPQQPAAPANVTPAVIAQVYNVEGVTVDRSSKNKMAVAEFQGQTMNETDLQTYFDMFVPDAKPGDDSIDRFIGDPGNGASADEASLDIQFIMGVAPGIKTDFYLYNSMDFCKDLKNWTSHMLADPVTSPHPETRTADIQQLSVCLLLGVVRMLRWCTPSRTASRPISRPRASRWDAPRTISMLWTLTLPSLPPEASRSSSQAVTPAPATPLPSARRACRRTRS